ncbi:NIPSNAP family protein [Tardiphaga robiniae]|uniref:NIPSNAP family protein n=1 Tax=Tardiphaga robiniae TaxID=943830 RepID=A0A7G6U1J6_9BRAD|nr:NIPSNAP family protein [Tardiphaga robiniae]QND72878.1 NIPSNAP family protein [Tardiphaga robiniae]
MLIDHRTYSVRPGTLHKQIALYERYGLAPQTRHFGSPLAYLIAETGDVNSYVHIWIYADIVDRSRRRAALMNDGEWQTYLEKAGEAGYVIKQESKLMTPAFAPVKQQ